MATTSPSRSLRSLARLATTLLALAIVVPLVPTGVAQSSTYVQTERTFYLHMAQYCERQSIIRWFDEFDWSNDLDGCGFDRTSDYPGTLTTTTWNDAFRTFVPFYANVTAASTMEAHIFMLSRAVDQITVAATMTFSYATCAGSDGPKTVTSERTGDWTEFVISCTFDAKEGANELDKPVFNLAITTTNTYGIGVEADHASFVKFAGLVPAPPLVESQFFELGERPRATFAGDELELEDNETLPAPKKDAPAFGVLTPALAVLIVATVVSRRRSV